MKLHLGCGQVYLDGYINIDFPLSKHSVQHKSVADKRADITKLKYSKNSIEEIRLHHVFEHFDRATACALVAIWSNWLVDGGTLRIEVPDFARTALSILSPYTPLRKRSVGLRHVFGSQEADWAIHYNGWSKSELIKIFQMFGLDVTSIKRNQWKGTYNIEIIGKKVKSYSKKIASRICRTWLTNFTVDDTPSERDLLEYWADISDSLIQNSWSK